MLANTLRASLLIRIFVAPRVCADVMCCALCDAATGEEEDDDGDEEEEDILNAVGTRGKLRAYCKEFMRGVKYIGGEQRGA